MPSAIKACTILFCDQYSGTVLMEVAGQKYVVL